jgi:hypothetical protein
MIMGICRCTALELSMMQDQKSLTLRWRSFLEGGSDMVVGPFVHKCGQYCHYGLMLSCSLVIIQDVRPEISNTTLTLISRMGQRACHLQFYIQSRPITPLWIDVTMKPFDCRKDQTQIVDTPLTLRWCSRWRHTNSHSVSNHFAWKSYCYYWQPISRFLVESLVSKASWPLSFWATTILVISAINDVVPSRFGAFSW